MPVRARKPKVKKLPIKSPILYDIHVMHRDPITKKLRWVSTPKYNLPLALAKSEQGIEETRSSHPYGTFILRLRNGVNPLEFMAENKKRNELTIVIAEPPKPSK